MATKVPLPPFHNITGEKFKRHMEDANYFDPFAQPAEPKGPWWARVLYFVVLAIIVGATLAMIFFPLGEAV